MLITFGTCSNNITFSFGCMFRADVLHAFRTRFHNFSVFRSRTYETSFFSKYPFSRISCCFTLWLLLNCPSWNCSHLIAKPNILVLLLRYYANLGNGRICISCRFGIVTCLDFSQKPFGLTHVSDIFWLKFRLFHNTTRVSCKRLNRSS